ncbi:RagB/SusD family nutrient uptake outer membrane protein [Sphingobacterium faecale]|uniref:RagB/SusD family nutrient uptake outer membrane protein n=1 Tax=Sphingobacterium faecale TaxID=2803775 RepID=A0ABS1RA11_9SPHI|nr:RagB/SusD family nutrient uptake outer membrane protein [Sphingobacterium faecale]MBL1411513.1 RagB/SusD family nutrient uptake outer membrane protein [Sphingobacterium faecale]
MKKIILIRLFLIILSLSVLSCQEYLDEKPFKYLTRPNRLEDLQALMNLRNLYIQNSSMPEVLADNYYVEPSVWLAATESDGKLFYHWDSKVQSNRTWNGLYNSMVYYPNVVLDQLQNFKETTENRVQYNRIKGQALFYRAFAYYQLAQLYCRPYSETAKTDPGIPLRTTTVIETPSVRATVQETYGKIVGDLLLALDLLPQQSDVPTQPGKAAVYGLLSRCYLSMRDYQNAGKCADLCLEINADLIDYNDIKLDPLPFKRFNKETVFYSYCGNTLSIIGNARGRIDTALYRSYSNDDLRKKLFFKEMLGTNLGSQQFYGCYDGEYNPPGVFNGITTGELYLNRAECYARDGKTDLALADLNTLLKARWNNTVTYPNVTATSATDALEKILTERRKELVYRGLRWSDLRRFNLEGRNISLERNVNGQKYLLAPNDPRWVLQIPDEVINRSGMPQNLRDQ